MLPVQTLPKDASPSLVTKLLQALQSLTVISKQPHAADYLRR